MYKYKINLFNKCYKFKKIYNSNKIDIFEKILKNIVTIWMPKYINSII